MQNAGTSELPPGTKSVYEGWSLNAIRRIKLSRNLGSMAI